MSFEDNGRSSRLDAQRQREGIPEFPNLKSIELSDREEVEAVTSQFPPYSDLNFTSLWSWDVDGKRALSRRGDTLIARLTDYHSGEPVYTFLGSDDPNQIATELISYDMSHGGKGELQFMGQSVVSRLDTQRFNIIEEPHQSDYVVATARMSTYEGPTYRDARRKTRTFTAETSDYAFSHLDLEDETVRVQMADLFHEWMQHQTETREQQDATREYKAFRRCLDTCRDKTFATGVRINGTIKGFWLMEDVGKGYAISHFEKAATEEYLGIFPYLKQQTAIHLKDLGVEHINLEQDLGLPGLRRNKHSYGPVHFLKKYTVTEKKA